MLAAFIAKKGSRTLPAPFWKWASTQCQRYLEFYHGKIKCGVAVIVYIRSFDRFCRLKCSWTLGCSIIHETSCDCLEGCRANFSCLSVYIGCPFLVYRCLRSFAILITRDGRAKIIYAQLTLLFMMGQGVSLLLFCQYRLSVLLLCITTTKLLLNYQTNKTYNRCCSVDAHSHDAVESILLSLLPMKDANTSIICNHYQIAFLLSDLLDQKLLTLC